MRRRFWLGIAAVTLVALGSVLAAALVYLDDRDDFHQVQREEAMRAAHQMQAVAGLSPTGARVFDPMALRENVSE